MLVHQAGNLRLVHCHVACTPYYCRNLEPMYPIYMKNSCLVIPRLILEMASMLQCARQLWFGIVPRSSGHRLFKTCWIAPFQNGRTNISNSQKFKSKTCKRLDKLQRSAVICCTSIMPMGSICHRFLHLCCAGAANVLAFTCDQGSERVWCIESPSDSRIFLTSLHLHFRFPFLVESNPFRLSNK